MKEKNMEIGIEVTEDKKNVKFRAVGREYNIRRVNQLEYLGETIRNTNRTIDNNR